MSEEKHLEEHVLVYPTSLLEQAGMFQGLSFDLKRYSSLISNPTYHSYLQRKVAETDPTHKQLIPYALLHHKNNFFVYRRGKLQGEKRLMGSFSMGIGGHISITDPALFGSTYEEGLKRELNEEIQIDTPFTQRLAAVLNDDSNEVGKVHFGVVHVLTLNQPLVQPKEKAMCETGFWSIEELQSKIDQFENWSKICIQNITKLIG
jgi:predicted NUDIX family phosphoesterase